MKPAALEGTLEPIWNGHTALVDFCGRVDQEHESMCMGLDRACRVMPPTRLPNNPDVGTPMMLGERRSRLKYVVSITALLTVLAAGAAIRSVGGTAEKPPSKTGLIASPPTGAATGDEIFSSGFESAFAFDLSSAIPPDGSIVTLGDVAVVAIGFTTQSPATPTYSLSIDGEDVSAQTQLQNQTLSFPPSEQPGVGWHGVVAVVGDAQAHWAFHVGTPPQITDAYPDGATLSFNSAPVISANFIDLDADIDVGSIAVTVDDQNVTSLTQITMSDPRHGTIRFANPQPYSSGYHQAHLTVGDFAQFTASQAWVFFVDVEHTYSVEFVGLTSGATVSKTPLPVTVVTDSNTSYATSVTVNGVTLIVQTGLAGHITFIGNVPLVAGLNELSAVVTFDDGEVKNSVISVTYDAPPVVTITSPRDWQIFGPIAASGTGPSPGGSTDLAGTVERPVSVTGTLGKPVSSVSINQQSAQISPDGMAFTFDRFFLHEGTNLLSVVATDSVSRVGVASRTVYVDQTAPLVTIEAPLNNAVTSAANIDVRGIANDAVEGGANAPEPSVVVTNSGNAGIEIAQVADRYYLAHNVPLEVGLNTLTVTATDSVGNSRKKSTNIVRTSTGSRRITKLAGDGQTGPPGSVLPKPLTIVAIDAAGLPIVGMVVRFDVLRGSGSLRLQQNEYLTIDGVSPSRGLSTMTDASGQALVWFSAGSEAAESGNVVRAASETISEEVLFTATSLRLDPKWTLVAGAAGTQYAATNGQPVDALAAIVLDKNRNAMKAEPVLFTVESGDATFSDQSNSAAQVSDDHRTVTVLADKNGTAQVRPTMGTNPGIVRISAHAGSNDVANAEFQIIVLQASTGPTAFTGIVLDHTGVPISGVSLSIARTSLSAVSDTNGQFLFDDQVPSGKIDLFVDGRAVAIQRNGQQLQYPALHFETAIVQGQTNQLPHPIYLPPINLALAKTVGGDQDVSFSVPGMDGFEMVVAANSVIFPDGSRQGDLVVTPVHGDRLPMVPPGGSASFGAIAWTLQPTGTRFDPPIAVKIPNVAGLRPGETQTIVQWDHDLATFVPMGRATVSEDASQLVSDAGSGITKAGWGGGPPPPSPNEGKHDKCMAPQQRVELRSATRADDTPSAVVTANGKQTELYVAYANAVTRGTLAGASVDLAVALDGCSDPQATWNFGDGSPAVQGLSLKHQFAAAGDYTVTASTSCEVCSATGNTDTTIRVVVFKVEITTPVTTAFTVNTAYTMPDVEFEVTVTPAAAADHLSYDWFVETELKQLYNGAVKRDDKSRVPDSGVSTVTGSTKWKPDWADLLIVADVVNPTVSAYWPDNADSKYKHQKTGYKILGANPSREEAFNLMGTQPWFIQGLANHESGVRQFVANPGKPLWGFPDGWGIMQTDPPSQRDDVYKWTSNIPEGINRVNYKLTIISPFWDQQVRQFTAWNLAHPNALVPAPPDASEGTCMFSYSPAGSQHSFEDAMWIKAYNGSSKPDGSSFHSGAYIYWENATDPPHWQIVNTNNKGEDYVEFVCNALP